MPKVNTILRTGYLFTFFTLLPFWVDAQPPSALQRQIEGINIERMMTTVRDISSPAFEGREVGTSGNKKAEEWLRSHFIQANLEPLGTSYDQTFKMVQYRLSGKNELYHKSDTLSLYPSPFSPNIELDGIISSTLPKNNIVHLRLPFLTSVFADTIEALARMYANLGAKALLIESEPDTVYHFDTYVHLPKLAKKNRYNTSRPFISPDTLALPIAFISEGHALSDGDRVHLALSIETSYRPVSNIVGLKQGSLSPKNILIVSVPFDGEGLHPNDGTPFGGASSTGTGLAVMLEWLTILEELNLDPEVSILFAGLNAGMRGNAGREYLTNHPILNDFNLIGIIELGSLGHSLPGTHPFPLYIDHTAMSAVLSQKFSRMPDHENLTISVQESDFPTLSVPYLYIHGDESPFEGRVLDAYNHVDYAFLFSNTQHIISLMWTLSSFN